MSYMGLRTSQNHIRMNFNKVQMKERYARVVVLPESARPPSCLELDVDAVVAHLTTIMNLDDEFKMVCVGCGSAVHETNVLLKLREIENPKC